MTTRRQFIATTAGALAATGIRRPGVERSGVEMSGNVIAGTGPLQSSRPVPSAPQLAWQRDELAMFVHFGVNTFTDREWGDGHEDEKIFAPAKFDARQWAESARAAGFRSMILTAKHHDGFCLWPTPTTPHSVAASPWLKGEGDVVQQFVTACRAEGLKPGLYLSPWDRHEPSYGDSRRYNDLYCDQLTELLTRYGPISEVWFDGANGEGPNGRKQQYDWPRVWALVRKLQPEAVMFSDAGPDVRWIGNERGVAGDTNWSTVDPAVVAYPGAEGTGVLRMLQQGDPAGSVWRPGETDVSIRPGWFHHPAEDEKVKTVDQLVDLYFTSVGRNSKLLLNVPPTAEGLLHATDVSRLSGMRERLDALFRDNLAAGHRGERRTTGARTGITDIDLGRSAPVGIVDLREDIAFGQAVARYSVEGSDGGAWRTLSRGTTIGCRKLDRFQPVRVRRVRLVIEEAVAPPLPVKIALYAGG
ncbi:MAG: alpha-L-fucosidase [Gemmatimonadales bacterium]